MNTNELRKTFLDYFQKKGHTIVPSSPLIPANDPTLLFVNAGMVQFKDLFLGYEKRDYTRATSSQRCLRISGKHNDLEQVGFTARHHTFFEMLGNFSFGDYFKREAIRYAWEFLTEVLKIPKEKLWITVYQDDDEAADIWLNEIRIDGKRFSRCGEKDNFWSMGDVGPCGPCTEIFYDHGEEIFGGPPGSEDAEGDRYIEIWNLVFMQYNRNEKGELTPLPKPSVDTGMGLERVSAVMQGVHNNYDIDLFQTLIKSAAKLTHCDNLSNPSLRVIADHIRAIAFLMIDHVFPSNEGRGYVLRRVIRRAIRHGNKLGMNEPFLYRMIDALIEAMGDAYPELIQQKHIIEKVLRQEEEQFDKTLQQGLKIFEDNLSSIKNKIIPGDLVFKLYDTYGFPADLTAVIAQEKGFNMDMEGFSQAMDRQRKQSQAASKFSMDAKEALSMKVSTTFVGYTDDRAETKILVLQKGNESADVLKQDERGVIVLEKTPFYAESGGQVGDTGFIKTAGGEFQVVDTQKSGDAVLHIGVVITGEIRLNDRAEAAINRERRQAIRLNHSATHLLHTALRQVLGDHVAQKGSLVSDERLRFDFSHFQAMTSEEIDRVEDLVNENIRAGLIICTQEMKADDAIKQGVTALFGEKYKEKVRAVSMGEFSKELCGGTHVEQTGNIGVFKILTETGIAAGVRRIEAVTGKSALFYFYTKEKELETIARLFKTDVDDVVPRLRQLIEENKALNKALIEQKEKSSRNLADELVAKSQLINGIHVLVTIVDRVDVKDLRDMLDQIKNKLKTAVIVLAAVNEEQQVNLIAGVTKDCVSRFHAGNLIKMIAEKIDGKGGGRPDMAQGGGKKVEVLSKALDEAMDEILKTLKSD